MKLLDPDKKYSVPDPRSETDALRRRLHWASANWYKTKNPEYVKQYHDAYFALRSRGWNGAIDIDAELPDNLMPQEYQSQVTAAQEYHGKSITWDTVQDTPGQDDNRTQAKRILVVDSDLGVRLKIGKVLEISGYEVTTARDGNQALERIAELQPALVVIDISLPDMDGFEVIRNLRHQPEGANIPIILLTERHELQEGLEYKWANVAGYIDKHGVQPKLIQDVLENVNRCFSIR